MDEKSVPIFDELFNALDNAFENDTDGLKALGAILTMPDDAFEAVKGSLCNSIEQTFNAADAKIACA